MKLRITRFDDGVYMVVRSVNVLASLALTAAVSAFIYSLDGTFARDDDTAIAPWSTSLVALAVFASVYPVILLTLNLGYGGLHYILYHTRLNLPVLYTCLETTMDLCIAVAFAIICYLSRRKTFTLMGVDVRCTALDEVKPPPGVSPDEIPWDDLDGLYCSSYPGTFGCAISVRLVARKSTYKTKILTVPSATFGVAALLRPFYRYRVPHQRIGGGIRG